MYSPKPACMHFENTLAYARKMDKADPLRNFRKEFYIPRINGREAIYLCGNSLGLQPRSAAAYLAEELEDWRRLGVEGHLHARRPWLNYHHQFSKSLARLTGAKPEEVVCMNNLTVNLNLMMVSFFRPEGKRTKVIVEGNAFPSDYYAVEQQLRFHGLDPEENIVELLPRSGEITLRTEDILTVIKKNKEQTALVLLGAVNYYTGQLFDLPAIAGACHEAGITLGLDLAHAIGNAELKLHDWQVDFAVWCSYKYLNSGPGAVSGVFIHNKYASRPDLPRFAGWWGNDEKTRFKMEKHFYPKAGADGWQMSNAPVLNMAAHLASLEIFDRAGMKNLRKKSLKLTAYLEFMLHSTLNGAEPAVAIITPSEPEARGCQLSLVAGKNGRKLFNRITKSGVIADWREPDVIRVAPVPLYNTFEDVWRFASLLAEPHAG